MELKRNYPIDIGQLDLYLIGFIETYRETSDIIGEYGSLVSIQNKLRTVKFVKRVCSVESLISLLP